MKNMKRIFALVLALTMVLSLAVTASAANTNAHTITIKNTTAGYTYEAYRVFEGDLVEDENGIKELTNIDWSDGINETGLMAALANIEAFKDCTTAVEVANVLAGVTAENHATTQAFADAVAANLATKAGESNTVTENVGYEIKVEGDGYYFVKTTAVPAATETTSEGAHTRYILKVVGDVNVTHKGNVPSVDKAIVENGEDKEATDAAIGDTVTFKLTATLPSDYSLYKHYTLTFHDTLSSGLTLNKESFEVKIGGNTITTGYEVVIPATDNHSFDVVFANLKTIAGVTDKSVITVTYTAVLNNSAVIGPNGNPNDVYLEYSNNPNNDGTGTPETGETPEDQVIVFTYELDVTKVDGVDNNIKLEGAEFKLYRVNADEVNEYAVVDANGKVTNWTTTKADGSTLTTNEQGLIVIAGLDAGTYYLEETKAPAGYNLPEDPFVVVITATVSEEKKIEELDVTVGGAEGTGNTTTGVVNGTIENNSGATLPETGGMGTTLFYIFGGILVLAAVVLLVTKKRMASAE